MANYINDYNGREYTKWSSARNGKDRLRHRPHISNTANSRGEGYVRYYSSLDADIYFGGIFIDEVVSINYSLQQNVTPIYGYNSYTFDDLMIGTRLVQGQFAVNFTESNYLERILATMEAISRSSASCKGEPLKDSASNMRNLPRWDKGFNIVIGYGEKNQSSSLEYDQITIIDCCQLTGCSQQLDANGEPLLEIYTFVARDLKYTSKQEYFKLEDSNTNIENSNNDNSGTLKIINKTIDIQTGTINIEANEGTVFKDAKMLIKEIQHSSLKSQIPLIVHDSKNKLFCHLTYEQELAVKTAVEKYEMPYVEIELNYSAKFKDKSISQTSTITLDIEQY